MTPGQAERHLLAQQPRAKRHGNQEADADKGVTGRPTFDTTQSRSVGGAGRSSPSAKRAFPAQRHPHG